MLKKINRKVFLQNYPEFIQSNNHRNTYVAPKIYNSYVLWVEAKSTTGLRNTVSRELTKLLNLLKIETINFLGDSTTPWLFRDHDYKPVRKALDYLVGQKISKSFNGAIQVSIEDFPEFIKQLFWLVRCNGIVFYAHFSNPEFNIMASICQYGNIHFSTLNEETDILLNKIISETGLHILTEGESCGGGPIYQRTSTGT